MAAHKTYHMCQSVRGALLHWSQEEWISLAQENKISPQEAKNIFLDYLEEGKRVIPIGEECEGFGYQTGCPGHEVKKEEGKHART